MDDKRNNIKVSIIPTVYCLKMLGYFIPRYKKVKERQRLLFGLQLDSASTLKISTLVFNTYVDYCDHFFSFVKAEQISEYI